MWSRSLVSSQSGRRLLNEQQHRHQQQQQPVLVEQQADDPIMMDQTTLKMKKKSSKTSSGSSILVPRWWKKRFSATITETDPSCKVVYLGNVLTGWAKGEGCLDKPLATLWKNYCQSSRPDVSMRLSVCSSGLQATTVEHGLTEYWAHRVTWCAAPPSYPRIFAWVYRHEGRRLKQELRCHAVLCTTGRQSRQLATRLEQRLREALHDFRREKLCRQSARLSLASCLYDDYSDAIPKRKLLLAPGINNYKPPVERCKSAPKLGSIEESPEQELEEEKDWLRVLALRPGPVPSMIRSPSAPSSLQSVAAGTPAGAVRLLETVREEERCLPAPPPPPVPVIECDPTCPPSTPDDVSPDGLLDLAEVKVTLMPDGGTSCVDGGPSSTIHMHSSSESIVTKPLRLPLLSRMSAEARKKFGSADCVVDGGGGSDRMPPASPPMIPRRARRSLPCRAASITDYTAELQLQQNRVLTRRQSQPEYVGVARRPTSEYIESRDEYLYDDEIHFRLRLDSAVEELLESDSFPGSSPCSSADHSPNLADKAGRLNLVAVNDEDHPSVPPFVVGHMLTRQDNDNVSDESGYSDDVKDIISSSSTASEPVGSSSDNNNHSSSNSSVKPTIIPTTTPTIAVKGPYSIAEEFTLNL